jgi:GTP pyrophosphokinase
MAQSESTQLGEKLLGQALRAEGIERLPGDAPELQSLWDKLLRFTGNKSRSDLLMDIGLGKRIASIVAKRLVALLGDIGQKPDALLLTRERFTSHETISQGAITLDGSENASVVYSRCCRPIPGDDIVGYLGRGEGLAVHTSECASARKLQQKDSERFIGVEWSDEPVRSFETGIEVVVVNGKGVLARVASAIATGEADIVRVDMGQELNQDAVDLRFILAVHNAQHLQSVLRQLRRTPSVIRAERLPNAG